MGALDRVGELGVRLRVLDFLFETSLSGIRDDDIGRGSQKIIYSCTLPKANINRTSAAPSSLFATILPSELAHSMFLVSQPSAVSVDQATAVNTAVQNQGLVVCIVVLHTPPC